MTKSNTLDEELDRILEESVPFIQPQELRTRLEQDEVVLLDIRSPREQEVSHIPGARFFTYEDFDPEALENVSREETIVVYCAVGYRSEKAGEKLQEMGFRHVLNLYGGIFEWKNKGFQVVSGDGMPTDSVHTYNEAWSEYLKNGVKVYD